MGTQTVRLLSSEVKPLTEELAIAFRDMEPAPTEREFQPRRVAELRHRFDQGLFLPPHWATVQLGEHQMRMNGRHSSTMLASLNGSFPQNLFAHLDHYEVPDEPALAVLFRQFDARFSSRTSSDVAGAFQGLYEPVRNTPRAAAKLAIDGIAWWRRNLEGLPVPDGDDVYSLFRETALHPFINWLGCEVLTIKTPELRAIPVVAAMYETVIAKGEAAKSFWHSVARGGDEFEEEDPTTVLDAWLKSLKEPKSVAKLAMKPVNFYQGCLFAFTAHQDGRSIRTIRSDAKKGLTRA
jgi:hypothetical protein